MQQPPPQQPWGPQQQPQQPWGPQRPPPSSGANIGLIIGIVFAVFVLGIFALLFLGGVLGFMRAKSAARARATYTSYATTTATAIPPSLDRSYTTKTGLVTAHYPSAFAAKNADNSTLTITKNMSDGTPATVQVAGVDNPISDDVNEFSRVLSASMVKNIEAAGDTFTETSRTTKSCLKSYTGLEISGSFLAKGRTLTNVRTCYFMHAKHGYMVKTIVAVANESTELPELQSIVDATELSTP